MKKIIFILFPLLSIVYSTTIGQVLNSVDKIKNFVKLIDSLKQNYDVLSNGTSNSDIIALNNLSLSEGIVEGEYRERISDTMKNVGSFEIYIFRDNASKTILRIYFAGHKNDCHSTQTYYYNNNVVVCAKMTVRRFDDLKTKPFEVEEYYYNKKAIKVIEENDVPNIKDNSIPPKSLYEQGIDYLKRYSVKK